VISQNILEFDLNTIRICFLQLKIEPPLQPKIDHPEVII